MRERIAQLAARLIAEDGVPDYALAKRKAARQIGAEDTRHLPGNNEIEQALRAYQNLYQKDEQRERLHLLRQQALEAMRLLERFNPHLTGSVLNGTAAKHSDINLLLFTDSAKEVELFLLGRQMAYKSSEKRFRFGDEYRLIPCLTLYNPGGAPASVDIAILAADALRNAPRSAIDGKPLERAKLKQVEALLELA